MNVLERILEEIEEATFQEDAPIYVGDMEVDGYVRESVVKKIVCSNIDHSGDDTEMGDWIPVEERLPNQNGVYNVTRLIDEAFISDSAYFDGQDTWHNDNRVNHARPYLTDIVAWQPLPEQYKPKKTVPVEEMVHIMSRFTRVE